LKPLQILKILFITLFFFNCKKSPSVYNVEDVQINKNTRGVIYLYNEKPITGMIFERNNSDIILKEFEVEKGILSGSYREFYANKNIKLENFYLNGKLEGISTSFYEDGSIKEKLNYSKGLLTGERKYFWENGLLKESNQFEKGIMTGKNIYFYANGQIQKSFELNSLGKRQGVWEDYYSNGQLKERAAYENGRVVSEVIKFDKRGKKIK